MSFLTKARLELNAQLAKEAKLQVDQEFRQSFLKIKNKMIADFLAHPVTKELEDGVNASNISGTLGGVTNLFSFIGFEKGDDPIGPILDLLMQTDYRLTGTGTRRVNFLVDLPEPKDIFLVTPLPFQSGRSWAKGIESGISGLNYFLGKQSQSSRSGFGIQSDKKVRNGVKFRNTKYITALLKEYQRKFASITL